MQKSASERMKDFRREWETLTPEEKEARLKYARSVLNQLLNFYLASQERNEFVFGANCEKENCPRDLLGDPVWQSLQAAIEAITENLAEDCR